MLKNIIYIFIGGGIGSVMRYLVSFYGQKFWNVGAFPIGTLLVNIIGCFIMGLLSAYFVKIDNSLRFLLITGFCGGFTTFSAFSAESMTLWQSQNYITLISYITISILLGLTAVFSGFFLAKL